MTAIYAFISERDHLGLLFSDNSDASRPRKRSEKIYFLEERFAIAICGLALPELPIISIKYFSDVTTHKKYNNIESLVAGIYKLTLIYRKIEYQNLIESYKNDEISQQEYDLRTGNDSELIIFDYEKHILKKVNFGQLYTDEILPNPIIENLESDKFHLFALASKANHHDKIYSSFDIEQFFISPIDYCEARMDDDRKTISTIGPSGSIFMARNKEINYKSCFSSPLDCLESALGLTPSNDSQ